MQILTHIIALIIISIMCLKHCLPLNTFESSPHIISNVPNKCNYCGVDSSDLDPTDNLFRIIQLNIRGLVNKQEKFSRLLHAF